MMNNWLKTTVLLAGLTALLLFFGAALGGEQGLIIALIIALVLNFGAYWFSDKIVLSMYKAKAIGPHDNSRLYSIVQKLAQKAGLPMPRVYVIPDNTPNAFATGRNPKNGTVAATMGILSLLNDNELSGVMAHELAHVKHRYTLISTIAATIAGAIGMLANWFQWAAIFGMHRGNNRQSNGIGAFVMALLAPVAASLIQMAISRSREFAADKGGAQICGNPYWLASALLKLDSASQQHTFNPAEKNPATAHLFIINPLRGKSVASLFSTHPPVTERVSRLKAMA
jgi:heat shock protein HtpX